ncbi:MAG: Stress responsive Barrel Domain-containing protein [Verrucomicrobiales bacterium]|nr:Stress responsive Barrel Domain-containing protein [Verrucomicrobiales bacterium]MDB6129724.1 Stress responsive Barrel Domain-containing protein [Verrucomicrobiales bacterium]
MSKVKHIALIKFKELITQTQIDDLFSTLLEISENIEGIEDYVSGQNTSPENLNQGYTHGFVMTFHDVAARDKYLTHPEHEKFKSAALPLVDTVLVFDFDL